MYIYLSKILPLMVLPTGLSVVLMLLALVFILKGWRKTPAALISLAALVLWVSSTPLVADALVGRLERDYPAVMITEIPASRCIVLLGGAVEPVSPPRIDIDMAAAADRVRKAAQLYRLGKGQVIIVSGGNQPWSPSEQSEAEAIKVLLMEWAVPAAAIVLEKNSRNTRENAFNTIALLQQYQCGTPLLVTSAFHMKRSVAVFAKLDTPVFPVSADVRVVRRPELKLLDFLPDAEAQYNTSVALKELIGWQVYRLQGWID